MSEYPIGLNGEMIHCFDDSEYAEYCRNKLEKEVNKCIASCLEINKHCASCCAC